MCVTFFVVYDGPGENGYRLILVNNRDEFWHRPTKPAEIYGKDRKMISGVDLVPGREGGTWLGVGQGRRLACLMNITTRTPGKKRGRGFLVTDFLEAFSSPQDHAVSLLPSLDQYRGFNLVLVQLSSTSSRMCCLTNTDDPEVNRITELPSNTCLGIGNSDISTPWQKVKHGTRQFADIVARYQTSEHEANLVNELVVMMSNQQQHLPDSVLATETELAQIPKVLPERSALCVWSPSIQYCSRTTTVILVTADGECHYYERDLQTPVVNPDDPEFHMEVHHLDLELDKPSKPVNES